MPDPMRPRRTYPQFVVAAVVVVGSLALSACGRGGGASAPSTTETAARAGIVRDVQADVSAVSLPDASAGGSPFTFRAEPGHILLAYFGYTGCPDVCPTTLGDLKRARAAVAEQDRDRMDVAMVTVDPARDTGEMLASYLAHFFDDAHALRTDDPAQLEAAKAAFGVQSRRNATSDPNVFTFDHTATVFAVDETGHIVMEWPYGTTAPAIAADVSTLLEERS